jgi:hypothetical protein
LCHLGIRGWGKGGAQGKAGRSSDAHGHRSTQEREGAALGGETGGRRTGVGSLGAGQGRSVGGAAAAGLGHQGAMQRQGHGVLVAGDRRGRLQQQGHEQQESGVAVTASVRGCAGEGRAGARGKSRAGYVGRRDAMQRLGLRKNL